MPNEIEVARATKLLTDAMSTPVEKGRLAVIAQYKKSVYNSYIEVGFSPEDAIMLTLDSTMPV